MTDGNEWLCGDRVGRDEPEVWLRVWLGPTAVAHYRADRDAAVRYAFAMAGHFRGLTYTVDPLPSFAPPTRPLPDWQLDHCEPTAP